MQTIVATRGLCQETLTFRIQALNCDHYPTDMTLVVFFVRARGNVLTTSDLGANLVC
jgi:hypothetical protein